jgi:hypothetical protein
MHDIAFLTQHQKLPAVAPAMAAAGFQVLLDLSMDTDTLGTFTGDIQRQGSQRDAALTKAKLAAKASNVRYGMGSEGSFGPDPFMGVTPWNIEYLVWWDRELEHVVEVAVQGPETNFSQTTVNQWAQAKEFALKAGFPEHGVIVGKPGNTIFDKSIVNWDQLKACVEAALAQGPLWLETDMRAHRNPTRLAMIKRAAQALSEKLAVPCPSCTEPGFGAEGLIPGAQCSACGQATRSARAQLLHCGLCKHQSEKPIRSHVPPEQCGYCNP